MKKLKASKVDELLVDVVEYAFVEWLIRRKVYAAFLENYDRFAESPRPFRECLRDHIRYLYSDSRLGPGSLISSAFLFTSTPEGCKFWMKHSAAWSRFFNSFLKEL
jgi:hypothetical protein